MLGFTDFLPSHFDYNVIFLTVYTVWGIRYTCRGVVRDIDENGHMELNCKDSRAPVL